MAFLLDTCVISEAWKPAPNAGVREWLEDSYEDELFLSALSLGEITKGIERLPDGKKKTRLAKDFALLRSRFSSRVLPVTDVVAERWGELSAGAEAAGRHLHVVDGLIAATAWTFGLTLVTRKVKDFEVAPVPVANPWA